MRLHPASVPYRSLSRSVSTGTLFFFVGVATSRPSGDVLPLVGMVVLGVLLGVVYEVAYYQRFRYELTSDTFDVTSGVLSRREREVPLRRVQNVDVRQNVVQRALGIAAVDVETAGGGRTEVTLRFVAEDEARRLQRRLRDGAVDESCRAGTTADVEGGELLFEIRPNELALLSAFTIDPGASILASLVLSFVSGFDPSSLAPIGVLQRDLLGGRILPIAWGIAVFVLAAWLLSATLTLSRYYGFRLTRVGDELHYERGLVQRYSGTIPLEKVQTLTIKETVPFRWFGYGSLAVETAGYAPGQSGSQSAVPLAAHDRVLALARSIEPFEDLDLERTPMRARERYAVRYTAAISAILAVGYVLSARTEIVEAWYPFAVLLFLVPLAAHLKWTSRGYQVGDRYFVTRTGFWRRTTKVVPYYRVQTVVNQRTIFQRRRRLASVTADTASSASFFGRAATAIDVDAERAAELQSLLDERLQERLRDRRRRRSLERWFGDAEDDPIDRGDGTPS